MNTQIELTQDELNIIEQKRAEEVEREATHQRIQAEKEERRRIEKEKVEAKISEMAQKLINADTDGILTQEHPDVFSFIIGEGKENVDIKLHKVYNKPYFRPTSSEWKYLICGACNNYRNQWIKSPKAVIKKVKEYQEAAHEALVRKNKQEDLKELTMQKLAATYPNAEVTFKGKYNDKPNRYDVTTDNGTVTFVSSLVDDEVTLYVYSRIIGNKIAADVDKMILG
jgi:hypothetical protein